MLYVQRHRNGCLNYLIGLRTLCFFLSRGNVYPRFFLERPPNLLGIPAFVANSPHCSSGSASVWHGIGLATDGEAFCLPRATVVTHDIDSIAGAMTPCSDPGFVRASDMSHGRTGCRWHLRYPAIERPEMSCY